MSPDGAYDSQVSELEAELIRLREEWRPTQAIAAIRRELGLPLAEAKAYLHDHHVWREALVTWDRTLDEFEESMKSDKPEE